MPLPVALTQFPTLSMKEPAGEAVTAFPTIELGENTPAVRLIIDIGQQVEGLGDPANFANGAGQCRRSRPAEELA